MQEENGQYQREDDTQFIDCRWPLLHSPSEAPRSNKAKKLLSQSLIKSHPTFPTNLRQPVLIIRSQILISHDITTTKSCAYRRRQIPSLPHQPTRQNRRQRRKHRWQRKYNPHNQDLLSLNTTFSILFFSKKKNHFNEWTKPFLLDEADLS